MKARGMSQAQTEAPGWKVWPAALEAARAVKPEEAAARDLVDLITLRWAQ
jgi:hypothetical protein